MSALVMSVWVGFYVNLSTLSRGNLTINVQSNYHSTAFVESQNTTEYCGNMDMAPNIWP
jgi:hypothetical protein